MEVYYVNALTQSTINHYENVSEEKIKDMIFHLERTVSANLAVEITNYKNELIKAKYVNHSLIEMSEVYRLFFQIL